MIHRPAAPSSDNGEVALGNGAFRLVIVVALLCGLLVVFSFMKAGSSPGGAGGGSAAAPSPSPSSLTVPSPSTDVGAFLYPDAREAPMLALTDPDGQPFTLASMRGTTVLVFFGYTNCPDVCPATIGILREAMRAVGPGTAALFVSIDPERDTVTALKQYVQYMPAGFNALTGTAGEIRATAEAWGVRYARVETGSTSRYSMAHTADVYLVDPAGRLRARFPFGTGADAMVAVLREVAATSQAPSASLPTPTASPPQATEAPSAAASSPTARPSELQPMVMSSSVWSGDSIPVILALFDRAGRLGDTSIRTIVQLTAPDGTAVGPAVEAVAVRPPDVPRVSYVATMRIPSPGPWRLAVVAERGTETLRGTTDLVARDPGSTPALGAPAPDAHTPTVADVGGDIRAVTTDPAPDRRLSTRSTTDVLAAHTPFILVVDSYRFKVTPACGRALVLARYLIDRWPDFAFIHLEPYSYSIVTDTPVLNGTLADPPLTDVTAAWGLGDPPWGAKSMPWVFIVDGSGIVRAKYQGVVGSDDVDVMVALLAEGH